MSSTLYEVFIGADGDYAPLSARAVKRILEFDRDSGHGPGGTLPNRSRFYLYLTQCGSDVQIRTVAVKAPRRTELPVVKEVALASVDDSWIHVRDLGFNYMGGYTVDWSPQGFGRSHYWEYKRWESEAYALRCMWKIDAPVINPELLKRTRRFRWSAWDPAHGYILDYLKIYNEHPEMEFLAKNGLGRFCTRVSVLRKLKADRNFRQFFMRNIETIQSDRWTVPAIMKAYGKGISLSDAQREIDARRLFRGHDLPRSICAVKALRYIHNRRTSRTVYANYLHDCLALDLDLTDTKVSFPKQFNRRRKIVKDQVDVLRAKENAAKRRKMNKKLKAVASEWSWLEQRTRSYRVVIPRTIKEMSDEGVIMANCLGDGYASKVARGKCVVFFVRRSRCPSEAFVAVEYDPKRGKITQCYGAKNSKPSKQVREFVERVFEATERREVAA